MINTIEDMSTLTAVPEKTFDKICSTAIYSICQNILEDRLNEAEIDKIYDFDIGIGILYIKYDSEKDEVKFKFKPSTAFKDRLMLTYKDNANLMRNLLSKNLGQKLLEVYKDLC